MSISIIWRRTNRRSITLAARIAFALGPVVAITSTAAVADVQVRGKPEAVRIEVQNSTIEEVLAALGTSFGLQFQSPAKLEKQINGTYQGSLQRVVARVLEGYNFVSKTSNGKVEITVLGTRNGAPATAIASSPSDASKSAPLPSAQTPTQASPKAVEKPVPAAPATVPPTSMTKIAQGPVPSATSDGPVPEIKLAEGPVPVPTPGSGLVPEIKPSTATLPIPEPQPAGSTLSAPEPLPSTAQPPMPQAGGDELKTPLTISKPD